MLEIQSWVTLRNACRHPPRWLPDRPPVLMLEARPRIGPADPIFCLLHTALPQHLVVARQRRTRKASPISHQPSSGQGAIADSGTPFPRNQAPRALGRGRLTLQRLRAGSDCRGGHSCASSRQMASRSPAMTSAPSGPGLRLSIDRGPGSRRVLGGRRDGLVSTASADRTHSAPALCAAVAGIALAGWRCRL